MIPAQGGTGIYADDIFIIIYTNRTLLKLTYTWKSLKIYDRKKYRQK